MNHVSWNLYYEGRFTIEVIFCGLLPIHSYIPVTNHGFQNFEMVYIMWLSVGLGVT
jgi:hypothetical protein